MKRKHPLQKIHVTDRGTVRFVENKIVSHLLDAYPGGLNALARLFRNEVDDYEQLMMLIGYSVSGFGDLDLNRRTIATADRIAARLWAARNAAHSAPQTSANDDQQ